MIKPRFEVRDIDREIISESLAALGWCIGVEDDLDSADDYIILGDDNWHGVLRSITSSVCVIVLGAP